MFKSWKTTLAGFINLGCIVAPFVNPALAPICAKIATAVTAAGFLASKDHDVSHSETPLDEPQKVGPEAKATRILKTPRMMLFVIGLGGLAMLTSAFTGMSVNNRPALFTGTTNNPSFACGIGSMYVNTSTTNPVVFIKTRTNLFSQVVNQTSLPTRVNFDTVTCNGLTVNGEAVMTGTAQFDDVSVAVGLVVSGNSDLHGLVNAYDGVDVAGASVFHNGVLLNNTITVQGESTFEDVANLATFTAGSGTVSGFHITNPDFVVDGITTNKYVRMGGTHQLEATAAP